MESDKTSENLQERVSKLEKKKKEKSIWEIVSVISSLLIPVSIFFAGFFLSEVDKQVKIQGQEKEIQLAEIKSKIDQAQLVASFLEALVDTSNSFKRQLAIKSILLALPDKGSEIVEEISRSDPNEKIKMFAKASLDNKINSDRSELIRDIFSPVKHVRVSATEKLLQDWRSDPLLVAALLDFAAQRQDGGANNKNGIVNTIVILNNVDQSLLQANKARVQEFIRQVEALQDRKYTQQLLGELKQRLE